MSEDWKHYFTAEFRGKMLAEPELKEIGTSRVLLSLFCVANKKGKKDRDGNRKEYNSFINLEMWGKNEPQDNAVQLFQSLNKFDEVRASGNMKFDEWTSKAGERRSKYSLTVDTIEVVQLEDNRTQQSAPQDDGPPVTEDDLPF